MIATALATEPRLLLLDEPAAGMVAKERKDLPRLIQRIRERGIAVLVIEHHMGLIMEVCSRIVVLNFGQKIAEGTPAEIQREPGRDRRLPGRSALNAESARPARRLRQGRRPAWRQLRRQRVASAWPWWAPTAPARAPR